MNMPNLFGAPTGSSPLQARVLLSATLMRALALVLALGLTLLLQFSLSPMLQGWNDRLTSHTWTLSDQSTQERRVVVIDIDEKSVQTMGPWPWPRDRVAQLLQALDQQGVSLKVVDILFDGPQDQDPVLANALQSTSPSVIAQLFALDPRQTLQSGTLSGALANPQAPASENCPVGTTHAYGYMAPTAHLLTAAKGVGHITPVVDPDGTIRRVPALICYQGQTYPALAVSALAAATGAQPQWRAQNSLSGPAKTLQIGSFELPIDEQGQLIVSYQTPRSGFIALSASDVMSGQIPPQLLQGVWALIGSTAFGAGDAVPTPQGRAVGGVEVHAQLLAAALDERTPYVPQWAKLWPWLSGAACVLVLLLVMRLPRLSVALTIPLTALSCALVIWGFHAHMLLVQHQVLAWGTPLLFLSLVSVCLLLAEILRVRFERERLYHNLSSYLPEGAARKVAFAGPSAQVMAQRQDATVMVVDLRNFSAYCEGRSPEESATVLHLFYTTVDRIVSAHGGEVEHMVGDSIMAVWNGSSPCPQHPQKAVEAAEQIWYECVAQLPNVASRQTPPLDVGIGVESGEILIGSFGPANRRAHTVLGETVTVASRLENLTAELAYSILLGPQVVQRAQPAKSKPLGDFLLVGLSKPHKIYSLPVTYGPSHLKLVYSLEQEQALNG